jgi:hypothetical protein
MLRAVSWTGVTRDGRVGHAASVLAGFIALSRTEPHWPWLGWSVLEGQDGLDVVGLAGVGIGPLADGHLVGNKAGEPGRIGLGEGLGREFLVAAVGVDRAEQDGVLQDHVPVEEPGVDTGLRSRRGDARHRRR